MQQKFEILNPLEHESWNDLLRGTANSTFFHTSNWARVLHDSYAYQPAYLARLGDRKFDCLLPVMEIRSRLTGTRGVSLPFSDYCTPLAGSDDDATDLFEQAVRHGLGAGWKYYEMRSGNRVNPQTPSSASFVRHVLALDKSESKMQAAFHSNTKRCIKKAAQQGVTVRMSTSLDSMMEYIRLNEISRRCHGLPPQPRVFFENIHRHVLSRDLGHVALATHDGRAVAGEIYFRFQDSVLMKYAAIMPEAGPLCAGFASTWAGLRHYAGDGCRSMCFGRTDVTNAGLSRFKESWGAVKEPLMYQCWDLKHGRFIKKQPKVEGAHNFVFRTMPLSLSRCIGSYLYKHAG